MYLYSVYLYIPHAVLSIQFPLRIQHEHIISSMSMGWKWERKNSDAWTKHSEWVAQCKHTGWLYNDFWYSRSQMEANRAEKMNSFWNEPNHLGMRWPWIWFEFSPNSAYSKWMIDAPIFEANTASSSYLWLLLYSRLKISIYASEIAAQASSQICRANWL